jgi:hypothetical protein
MSEFYSWVSLWAKDKTKAAKSFSADSGAIVPAGLLWNYQAALASLGAARQKYQPRKPNPNSFPV